GGGRGLDPLVLDDLLAQVHQQRLAVRRVAAELVACLLVSHRAAVYWRGPAPSWSVLAEAEAPRVQRFDHLVDRLFAEVGDRVQLGLGLRDEVADRLDAGALEAVVGAHAELELLDQDAPLLALQGGGGAAGADCQAVAVELPAGAGPK